MAEYKLLIEVLKNGEFFMKSDAGELSDFFDMCASNIQRKAAVGGVIRMGDDKYLLRHTGEKAPKRNPYEKAERKPKPKYSIAQINRMAREAGMDYGNYVALHGIK